MTRTAFCKEGGEGGGGGGRRAERAARWLQGDFQPDARPLAAGTLNSSDAAAGAACLPRKKRESGRPGFFLAAAAICQGEAPASSSSVPRKTRHARPELLFFHQQRSTCSLSFSQDTNVLLTFKKSFSFLSIVAVKNLKALHPEAGRPALAFVFPRLRQLSQCRERRVL